MRSWLKFEKFGILLTGRMGTQKIIDFWTSLTQNCYRCVFVISGEHLLPALISKNENCAFKNVPK